MELSTTKPLKEGFLSLKEKYSQLTTLRSLLSEKNEEYRISFLESAQIIKSLFDKKISTASHLIKDAWTDYCLLCFGDLHLSSIKEDLKFKLGLSSAIPPHKLYCHYKEKTGGSSEFRYRDFICHHIVYHLFIEQPVECDLPSPSRVSPNVLWVIESVCEELGITFKVREKGEEKSVIFS
jgi:hypothetical protein